MTKSIEHAGINGQVKKSMWRRVVAWLLVIAFGLSACTPSPTTTAQPTLPDQPTLTANLAPTAIPTPIATITPTLTATNPLLSLPDQELKDIEKLANDQGLIYKGLAVTRTLVYAFPDTGVAMLLTPAQNPPTADLAKAPEEAKDFVLGVLTVVQVVNLPAVGIPHDAVRRWPHGPVLRRQ
jgi:hypothetical protein